MPFAPLKISSLRSSVNSRNATLIEPPFRPLGGVLAASNAKFMRVEPNTCFWYLRPLKRLEFDVELAVISLVVHIQPRSVGLPAMDF